MNSITVDASKLKSLLLEISAEMKRHGLTQLCEMYIKDDNLILHCFTSGHFFGMIPIIKKDMEDLFIVFRLIESIKLLSDKDISVISELGDTLRILNLNCSLSFSITKSIVPQYTATNLNFEKISSTILVSQLNKIYNYMGLSNLFKKEIPLLLGDEAQLRYDGVWIRSKITLKVLAKLSRNNIQLLSSFNPTAIAISDNILAFKRKDAKVYLSREIYSVTSFDNFIGGMIPLLKADYPNLIPELKILASTLKKSRARIIFRKESCSITVSTLQSEVLINMGNLEIDSPVLMTLEISIEVAYILFNNLGNNFTILRNKEFILLKTNYDEILLSSAICKLEE